MLSLVLILCSFGSQTRPLLLRSREENLWSLGCSVVPSHVCWARLLLAVGLGLLIAFFRDVILQCQNLMSISFPCKPLVDSWPNRSFMF